MKSVTIKVSAAVALMALTLHLERKRWQTPGRSHPVRPRGKPAPAQSQGISSDSAGTLYEPSTEEKDDRETDHDRSKTWASWAQVAGAVISAGAVAVALVVACQGQTTIDHNTQSTIRQSEDSQLSTAITALGSNDASQRVAGLILLERNATARFTLAPQSGESLSDVYEDYITALRVLSGYLSAHGQAFLMQANAGHTKTQFGRGYGVPPPPGIPQDVINAADEVKLMLAANTAGRVLALHLGRPAIDLANDELIGQPWSRVNFRWMTAFMPGIDLRAADLEYSRWGRYSTLNHAYLQCADLRHAVFRGANLTDVDLRGANVEGADFRGAKIKGTKLTQLYGSAKWSWQPKRMTSLPAKEWSPLVQRACLLDHKLWDNRPASASAPISPKPSPRAPLSSSATRGNEQKDPSPRRSAVAG